MALTPGTRLGPYEIAAPLGAGGMGEVYRARDARLGRDVALKILPAEVANDPSRRARFETEARAAAGTQTPRTRVIALESGKPAAPLVNTTEETTLPATPAGKDRVALLIGPEEKRQIAIVSVTTGKILSRISVKGPINTMVSSVDEKTLYFAADHGIWTAPVSGGKPTRIRDGDRYRSIRTVDTW